MFSLFGLRGRDFISQLWKVYIDDSADAERKKFVVAGCLFGTKTSWSAFNKEWRKTLREQPRIEYFHGKELRRLAGEFAQFRDPVRWPKPAGSEAANRKRDALRSVIERQSGLVAFGVGVLVPEYRRVRATHPRGRTFLSCDPFEYVLEWAFLRAAETAAGLDKGARIAFMSDDSSRATIYSKVYAEWKIRNPVSARSMRGLGHGDDKQIYGLQAADMAASVVKGSAEALDSSSDLQAGFPLESRFWRIEFHREENLIRTLHTQPLQSCERREDNRAGEETP
jgi:uncharacterized protein DUF3800